MAYPPPTPPLDKEETKEFLKRLDNFKLTDKQMNLYRDSLKVYDTISSKKARKCQMK